MLLQDKWASATIIPLILLVALAFPASSPLACGWWGDGEDDDADAIIVLPEGKSDADLAMDEARTLLKTSGDPKRLTRSADRLLKLIPTPERGALAARLLTKAARLGFAPAQNNLGVLLEKGKGVRQDMQKAAIWFGKAARQGDPRAQHSLAMMYFHGRGIPEDREKARLWLERSARLGHASACKDLKKLYGVAACPQGAPDS